MTLASFLNEPKAVADLSSFGATAAAGFPAAGAAAAGFPAAGAAAAGFPATGAAAAGFPASGAAGAKIIIYTNDKQNIFKNFCLKIKEYKEL